MAMSASNDVCSSERGAALIVALFILLILTALGVTAVGTSVFEQKMSANKLDRDSAFQAAETALREGEGFLEGLTGLDIGTSDCNASANPCVSTLNSVNGGVFTNGAPWGANDTYSMVGYGDVNTPPEYVVEYFVNLPDTNSSLGIGTGVNMPGSDFYRVTARGTGRTDAAQAIVQSVYARRF